MFEKLKDTDLERGIRYITCSMCDKSFSLSGYNPTAPDFIAQIQQTWRLFEGQPCCPNCARYPNYHSASLYGTTQKELIADEHIKHGLRAVCSLCGEIACGTNPDDMIRDLQVVEWRSHPTYHAVCNKCRRFALYSEAGILDSIYDDDDEEDEEDDYIVLGQ